MHKKLFIPGPIDCRPEVLEKLSQPMIGHRTKEATEIGRRIEQNMQKIFRTKNTVVISTTSGSGLMESAIKCCTAKRAAVFSVGSFGDRWLQQTAFPQTSSLSKPVSAQLPKWSTKFSQQASMTSSQLHTTRPPAVL